MLTLNERLQEQNELLRRTVQSHLTDLRVACPGIIQSYDSGTQTATVQLAIKENVNLNGNITQEEIPELIHVPVMMIRGGGYMVEVTPVSGDEVLIVFSDNCYDSWWQSGGIQAQLDKRRHDLSDGIAILGLWSQPNVITSGGSGIRLRDIGGNTKVEVVNGNINLSGSTVNINATNLNINVTDYSLTAQTSTSNGNGNSTIDGKKFLTHEHSGIEPGSGNSGGVV